MPDDPPEAPKHPKPGARQADQRSMCSAAEEVLRYAWPHPLAERSPLTMERIVRLHIARLPEGMYLATSEDIQGLLAQGRTVSETVEIARDVARKLLELQQGSGPASELESPGDSFELPLVVSL